MATKKSAKTKKIPSTKTAIRKVNRPVGEYPCPFEHGYMAFSTKKELADHIAREHVWDVANLAEQLQTMPPDAANHVMVSNAKPRERRKGAGK